MFSPRALSQGTFVIGVSFPLGRFPRVHLLVSTTGQFFPQDNTWTTISTKCFPGYVLRSGVTYVLTMIYIWLVCTQKDVYFMLSFCTYVSSTQHEIFPNVQKDTVSVWNNLKILLVVAWFRNLQPSFPLGNILPSFHLPKFRKSRKNSWY